MGKEKGGRLSPSQAAKRIGCSKNHVLWMIRKGKLPAKMKTLGSYRQYEIEKVNVEKARKTWLLNPVKRGPKRQPT